MSSEHSPLIDILGSSHALQIQDDHIILDQRPVVTIRQAETVIFTTNDQQDVICTPEACWYAVAGGTVPPTAAEAGQLLASNLAYWNDALRLQALVQSLFRLVGEQEPMLCLPPSRLDPFIETALSRLPQHTTLTRVTALAQVIDQPLARVIAWLQQRGKTVQVPEPPSVDTFEEEAAPDTEALSAQIVAPATPSSKRPMFRWTPEMVEELTKEFLDAPLEESISATARTIAAHHDWLADKVEYKVHQLGLPGQRQEPHRAGVAADVQDQPQPVTEAVATAPVLEQEQHVSRGPVMQESRGPVELHTGNYAWDGHVDGEKKRWYLDYPYGTFPVQKDAQVIYRNHIYKILMVGSSSFTASTVTVTVPQEESEVSHVA